MREEILSTEAIFRGRVVNLDVHTVRLPDGEESKREVIRHSGAVGVIAVDAEQHVLLVRQFRIGANRTMIEIPAGLLEVGEDPEVAAIRELREETGYRPTGLEAIGGTHAAPGYTTEYIHLYHATGYEPAPLEQDADEFVESMRIPFSEALDLIDAGEITEAKSVVGLLRVARKLGL